MFLFVFTINLTPIRQLLLITGSNDLVEINNVREWWSHKIFIYNTIITYFYFTVTIGLIGALHWQYLERLSLLFQMRNRIIRGKTSGMFLSCNLKVMHNAGDLVGHFKERRQIDEISFDEPCRHHCACWWISTARSRESADVFLIRPLVRKKGHWRSYNAMI